MGIKSYIKKHNLLYEKIVSLQSENILFLTNLPLMLNLLPVVNILTLPLEFCLPVVYECTTGSKYLIFASGILSIGSILIQYQ